jgi:hypothetical protein
MTQPLRLNVFTTRSTEKPPSIEIRIIIKQIFRRCIPCIKSKNRDEKLPLSPRNNKNDIESD